MADSIAASLERSRAELLDLGLRNTLLNYRELKSKGVRVVDAEPGEVFDSLVREGRSLSFRPAREEEGAAAGDGEASEQPVSLSLPLEDERSRDGQESNTETPRTLDALQTPYAAARLQKRLLNTHYAARTALQEQGVNVLFLALGMLEWYEDRSSDILRRAPLVLVPVTLSRASVQARFKLEHTGDDLDTNLSLQMKLKKEFGVELPSVGDGGDSLDVASYFEEVAAAVRNIPDWRIDREAVAVGFFSFNKLLMYKDLDEENWPEARKPSDHPVLRSILGEGFDDSEPLFQEDERLDDRVDPDELHQVRDADSSQTEALLETRTGRSVVIQGPPGTGKSQTITNLVAEAIAEGKTVLFVSEKMAALEVVKMRLDEVGLGDACLELHSHKTNKKNFLEELERTLSLGRPRHEGRDKSVQELKQARDRLNAYCEAVNTPVRDTGVSPYGAYGTLLRLREGFDRGSAPQIDEVGLGTWSGSEYTAQRSRVEELQKALSAIGVPADHPYWRSNKKAMLPGDERTVEKAAGDALNDLRHLRDVAERLSGAFTTARPEDLFSVEKWIRTARKAEEAPDLTGVVVDRAEWIKEREALQRLSTTGRRIREVRDHFDSRLVPEAWEAEVLGARKELAAYATKWWRFLSGNYRQARREILGLSRAEASPSADELLRTADAILEVQRRTRSFEEASEVPAELFGSRWEGWRSDWDALDGITTYLAEVHEEIEAGELPRELLVYLKAKEGGGTLAESIEDVESALEAQRKAVQRAVEATELDEEARFGDGGFSGLSFESQEEHLRAWKEEPRRLQEMVRWNHLAGRLREEGLGPVVDIAASWDGAAAHLVDLLDWDRNYLLLKEAHEERPNLPGFDGEAHGHAVQKFREADKRLLELNQAYLARKHWEGLPGRNGPGQMGVLRREFRKRARHRPIRQLMLEAGHAVQAIKPVFMMSPLSVAAYIPPESLRFDLVVFDEASQVRPVDSFGAILRGEQSVVVGDSRQLPPTTFFDKLGLADEEDEDEWDAGVSDLESVLGVFAAQGARDPMLRWHYRSQHESLIAVSNHEFYDDNLVVCPSPDNTREALGLVFHHLQDTAYERGKGTNRDEAEIVAKAVMRHARERPQLTLGVASFGSSQMQAIQDQLEILRLQDPSCEGFFADHPYEPFFVKNLENVQGDERDVIFISVGFGRTQENYLAMHFGPLNQDGGERRLNVLISRARRRCEVFSNLRSDDIDLNRSKARGVAAFKTFLKYAETGQLDAPRPNEGEPDSEFEEAVGRAVRGLGLEVDYQVGSAGFFIDLGVVDPEEPGRYLLGIECDGATYHSARWARDRDRLRQDVLEGLGWRIHRIWSTDWFQDPAREIRRVAESIEQAKAERGSGVTTGVENGIGPGNGEIDRHPPPDPAPEVQASRYETASLTVNLNNSELHTVSPRKLAGWVEDIVSVESPVHVSEVASRIAGAAGVQRVGSRIQAAVDRAAKRARVRRQGDFLWTSDMERAPVRDRGELPNSSRKIERVAPEELAEAVLVIVDGAVGVAPDEAAVQAARLLGYSRATDNIKEHIDGAIRTLLADERLKLSNGFLVLSGDGKG